MIEKKENVKRLGFPALATLALALSGVCASWAGAAITADYFDGFTSKPDGSGSYSSGDTPQSFTVTSPTLSNLTRAWNVQGGAFRYTAGNSSSGSSGTENSTALVQVSNLGGTPGSISSFTVSSTLKLDAASMDNPASSKTIAVGLVALGTSPAAFTDIATNPAGYYSAVLTIAATSVSGTPGSLTLGGGSGGQLVTSGASRIAINTSDTYLLSLTGTYAGSALELSFTVTDLTTPSSVTVSSTDTDPLTGQYFGLRSRITGNATHVNVQANFDNFTIDATAIPEPATATMALGSLAAATLVRRKRPTA